MRNASLNVETSWERENSINYLVKQQHQYVSRKENRQRKIKKILLRCSFYFQKETIFLFKIQSVFTTK